MVFHLGDFAAMVIHASLIPLFLWLGANELAAFNVISLLMYASGMVANWHGHHMVTMLLALFELCIHQSLCVIYLGWGSGFQYYLFCIPGIVFFLVGGKLAHKVAS